MSRGMPSLTALLGLLAIAGYQNKDKLAEMLSGAGNHTGGQQPQAGLGGHDRRAEERGDRAIGR